MRIRLLFTILFVLAMCAGCGKKADGGAAVYNGATDGYAAEPAAVTTTAEQNETTTAEQNETTTAEQNGKAAEKKAGEVKPATEEIPWDEIYGYSKSGKISKAYQLGYDRGYDDGEDDAVGGNGWMGQFDDTNNYRGKKKRDYEQGYEEGYEAGYDDNMQGYDD